jgi:hypothetical protein
VVRSDFLVELRGFEPMAIAGAGRSRATESDGGQARRAKGLQLTRANGDCGVDGVDSVGEPSLNEPRRSSWFRGDWCGCDSATATTADLAGVRKRRSISRSVSERFLINRTESSSTAFAMASKS